ncbi:TetR/AcrR family transcriptional regulator [Nocardia sp. NPDC051832]|uniref:TetR/AcrR family transcriptional regulator n=1 Tax=Nocardia sp. NPDC051832 TaxID=3155673 RepID=UPI00343A8865
MPAQNLAESPLRQKLIDATEEMLLTTSYEDLSVRAVCAAADANVAAVRYHFGSKAALVAAVLQDRLGPLWTDRLRELMADADGADVATCVQAIVAPLRDLAADPVGQVRLHLLTRILFVPGPQPWTDEWFALSPFVELVRRACPEIGGEELARRWVLAFRLILLEFGNPIVRRSAPAEDEVDAMVRFVVAGLTAETSEARAR